MSKINSKNFQSKLLLSTIQCFDYNSLTKKQISIILDGISKEWKLSNKDMIEITKGKRKNQIDFISFYDEITSYYAQNEDIIDFINNAQLEELDNLSIIKYMKERNIEDVLLSFQIVSGRYHR